MAVIEEVTATYDKVRSDDTFSPNSTACSGNTPDGRRRCTRRPGSVSSPAVLGSSSNEKT